MLSVCMCVHFVVEKNHTLAHDTNTLQFNPIQYNWLLFSLLLICDEMIVALFLSLLTNTTSNIKIRRWSRQFYGCNESYSFNLVVVGTEIQLNSSLYQHMRWLNAVYEVVVCLWAHTSTTTGRSLSRTHTTTPLIIT